MVKKEKVAKEAAGLAVKSPTEQTAAMTSKRRRIEEDPAVSVVEKRSEDNIDIAREAIVWIRWELEIRFSSENTNYCF